MTILLLKVTLVLALALAVLPLLRRASAALRHLVCACALAGTLLLPLSLLSPPEANVFRISSEALPGAARVLAQASVSSSVFQALFAIWGLGSLLLLLRIAAGHLALRRLLRTAKSLQAVLPAAVFFADIGVPVACGLFRPVVLLPREAEAWSGTQTSAALQHELQHVQRGDLWTTLLGHVACAVYWFHPLAWLVAGRLRHEQESACDDAVLATGFEPASYAEALLAAARQITSTRLIGCHMLSHNNLQFRITRLFNNHTMRIASRASVRTTLLCSAAALVLVATIAGAPPARAGQDQVYKVGAGIAAPKVIFKVDPEYSPEAESQKIEGTVLLNLVVGADGFAREITVVRALGSGLDEKAVEAVQKWRFQPGMKDGQPVSVRATIEMNFRRV